MMQGQKFQAEIMRQLKEKQSKAKRKRQALARSRCPISVCILRPTIANSGTSKDLMKNKLRHQHMS